jgi:spore maturation protein CgeB
VRIVYFTHSLTSCWNHGNAHFLRGVLRALIARGCEVRAYEPEDAWSRTQLVAEHGEAALTPYRAAYPELCSVRYGAGLDLAEACDGADAVLVHEWNEPSLVARLGAMRRAVARFTLLFLDNHQRAVSDPAAITAFDLSGYDGILAFGETLAEVYRAWGWGRRVFVWHEAADVTLFHPPAAPAPPPRGRVWIGNWGDGERTEELERFLFEPAAAVGLPLDVYGVRYPDAALSMLKRYGARYRGWLANARAPQVFARSLATVHVPRRFYAEQLPGIPTIRVFEALACGTPLVCAPWDDSEQLFRPGVDYLAAQDGEAMRRRLRDLRDDPDLRASLARHGLETILARHTCGHRAEALIRILAALDSGSPAPPAHPALEAAQ